MLEETASRRDSAARHAVVPPQGAAARPLRKTKGTPATSRDAGGWRPVVDALGLDKVTENAIAGRAAINGTSFRVELLASG
jgi:hypothetical protein